MRFWVLVILLVLVSTSRALAQRCGNQAGGALCSDGLCCSEFGYCGMTLEYCSNGCQSQCNFDGGSNPTPSDGSGNISSLISQDMFNEMLKHRNDSNCPANGFYTYDAFISAAQSFDGFGTIGDIDTRKREIAAFLGQTSHETTGGWPSAPDGPFAWGYCYNQEQDKEVNYCVPTKEWACAPGKKYYGRGPILISYNFNYGAAGKAIGIDLLNNPDAVAADPIISFKTALWFWMTPQSPKPSCHAVITGQWKPSASDVQAGRLPGYGVISNIISGSTECGKGSNPKVENRIGFYKRYCDIFKVGDYGDNLDCSKQRPFGEISSTNKTVPRLIKTMCFII
ncbi:hypothetical protein JCGZ_22899 [Jatropha curcas]|uniref:Chitin-binding type-1 domain-containing protein n=1 Tax=Jatropha curcas TaxID=180498 RepID=A0A067K238_JATCU|nr:endochitinase [Jatropha curcas]KDP25869.1 hypothetical protein JCGZ_22899 [Jatropha curcas]